MQFPIFQLHLNFEKIALLVGGFSTLTIVGKILKNVFVKSMICFINHFSDVLQDFGFKWFVRLFFPDHGSYRVGHGHVVKNDQAI